MKKVIFALFASAMLVACGGTASNEASTDSTSVDSSAVVTDTTAVAPTADSTSVK